MKRFWLVLLSLGLIVAFSTSAMAVDVKFSGEYYAAGLYLDKTTFKTGTASDGPSTAFFFQRLRLNGEFVVAPGLSLITRADIMERAWGANRSDPGTAQDQLSAGTRAENQNIAFDLAYLRYISPIGIFLAGYQIDGAYGTTFGDSSNPVGKIGYMFVKNGFYVGLQMGKNAAGDQSYLATNTTGNGLAVDRDSDFYTAYVNYVWKTGTAGILYKFIRSAGGRTTAALNPNGIGDNGFETKVHVITPFVKVQLGPVALQAQVYSLFGQQMQWEASLGNQPDSRIEQLGAWIDATGNFGMFYAGGSIAYLSGNDPSDGLNAAGAPNVGRAFNGGLDWNPCLILFNSDLSYWAGSQAGYGGTDRFGRTVTATNGGGMSNAWFGQIRGGVRPVEKLDIGLAISYANAVKKPTTDWLYNDYGYEVDLTGTYKITNNLSYMLGGGYLFTGKYFRGAGDNNSIANDFLVINKLTLTF